MTYNKKAYNVKPYHSEDLRLDKELENVEGSFVPFNESKVDDKLEKPISMSHIGKTVGESQNSDILKGFKTAINQGASKVELSLGSTNTGAGTGFGYHGPKKRKAIKEMSKATNVKINSIHTPPTGGEAVGNLSGLGREGINEENREKAKRMVKRTIDFAYDVTSDNEEQIPEEGISVVVHTGEFPRSMKDVNKKDNKGRFKQNDSPKHYFVDLEENKTSAIDEKRKITFSNRQIERLKESDDLKKFHGLYDVLNEVKDESNGYTELEWKDIENIVSKDSEIKNNLNKKLKEDENLRKALGNDDGEELTPTEAFVKLNYFFEGIMKAESEIAHAERLKKQAEMKETQGKYKEIAEAEKRDSEMRKMKGEIQLKELEKRLKKVKDIEKVAMENTIDSYADLAEHIYEKQKKEGTEKNVYLAPENITPESYGSHPDELKDIVKKARKEFKKRLKENHNINEKSAEKIAKDKIKATFDTQHLAMWGQHFEGSEEEFWEWYDDKVEEMAKEGIIGNVHMVDGDMQSHAHQPIGHGKIPIQKAMSKIKKYYEENDMDLPAMNSEGWGIPGDQGGGEQLTSAWRELSHFKNTYIPNKNRKANFSEIEDSYFMRKSSPYFVFGKYSPSESLFSTWSGLPLE